MGRERLRHLILKAAPSKPLETADVALALLSRGSTPRRVRIGNGLEMDIILPDHTSIYLRMGIPYEKDVTAYMEKILKKDSTFFDVGAHFGYHSLMASSMVGPDGRIVAFEPTPTTYEVLCNNSSRTTNITTENVALNDGSSAQVELQDFGSRYCGINTIAPNARISAVPLLRIPRPNTISVPAVSLDGYLTANPNIIPDVIKIDAENSEMPILRGASRTIKQYTPAIILECGDLGRTTDNCTNACLDFLGGYGYVFYNYDFRSNMIQRCSPQNTQGDYNNVLCVHQQKAF